MLFGHLSRRPAAGVFLGTAALAGAASLAGLHPAAATSAIARVASLVTCASASPCASWTNSSTGPGLTGSNTKNGYGVGGYAANNYGVYGYSSGSAGVTGKSASSSAPGVAGYSDTNVGVYGSAHKSGTGVKGYSEHGAGVFGTTQGDGSGVSGSATSGKGVEGSASTGEAVYGFAPNGNGVVGASETAVGVFGYGDHGTGVYAETSNGTALSASADQGFAVVAKSAAYDTIFATNSNGIAGLFEGTSAGLEANASASGFPLVLNDPNGGPVFYVDSAGNVSYHGTLSSFARTAGGGGVTAYSPQTTTPTVEDTGTAELVGGSAAVRLDPAFAASIDPRAAYRVFLTPNGDTRGLYVPVKTANGFVVREAQNGRSSVTFDYRIVATRVGQAATRMTILSASAAAARQPQHVLAPLPIIKPISRPKPGLTATR